ncbi:MAG: tRNA pseudouridine(55) synthase TruB [Clostridia bacterium]|nr:tRNA pseudouridine(55) synthase TruB [Clostridia bacterium]
MIGFLNINKPADVSSAFITNKIKHKTKQKVGHLGTLDPMATGVLPVAIGKATRLFDYFLDKDKEYVFSVKFGILTDTLDICGQTLKENNIVPSKNQILNILPEFIGKQMQIPPQYSAKSVNGERAYKLARNGETVNLPPKEIEIYSLELLDYKEKEAEFKMHCSSGTYVRSVARDLANKLKTIATTIKIHRTKSGFFKIEDSVSLESVLDNPDKYLVDVLDVLKTNTKITLTEQEKTDLLCGKVVKVNKLKDEKNVVLKTIDNRVYGLANIENGIVKVSSFLLED